MHGGARRGDGEDQVPGGCVLRAVLCNCVVRGLHVCVCGCVQVSLACALTRSVLHSTHIKQQKKHDRGARPWRDQDDGDDQARAGPAQPAQPGKSLAPDGRPQDGTVPLVCVREDVEMGEGLIDRESAEEEGEEEEGRPRRQGAREGGGPMTLCTHAQKRLHDKSVTAQRRNQTITANCCCLSLRILASSSVVRSTNSRLPSVP